MERTSLQEERKSENPEEKDYFPGKGREGGSLPSSTRLAERKKVTGALGVGQGREKENGGRDSN